MDGSGGDPFRIGMSFQFPEAQLRQELERRATEISKQLIIESLRDGRNGKKGQMYQVIEHHVGLLLEDPKTHEAVQQIIAEMWPGMLREATIKALEHKANRVAFTATKKDLPLNCHQQGWQPLVQDEVPPRMSLETP